MSGRRFASILLAVTVAVLLYRNLDGIRGFVHLFYGTPHERYAASLIRRGVADTAAGRIWLATAEESLARARPVNLPRSEGLSFAADDPQAAAFSVALRRGQRYIAEAVGARVVFIDVFRRDGRSLHHVANASQHPSDRQSDRQSDRESDRQSDAALEVGSDGEYVIRVQPEIEGDVRVTLVQRAEPTLPIPVERATPSKIQSFFGSARDAGRREHQGVDIFAPRGTHVIAAAGGLVSSVGTNRLGGNVIWVARLMRGETYYYAHLDTQLVTVGTRVKQGDVIGTVGNTGNARSTAPHLHFGIYTPGGAIDPLPYIATRSARTSHVSRGAPPRSTTQHADAKAISPGTAVSSTDK
jgi:murein DD-endopeptidase MepM/ murein hydrolase activator NlpD